MRSICKVITLRGTRRRRRTRAKISTEVSYSSGMTSVAPRRRSVVHLGNIPGAHDERHLGVALARQRDDVPRRDRIGDGDHDHVRRGDAGLAQDLGARRVAVEDRLAALARRGDALRVHLQDDVRHTGLPQDVRQVLAVQPIADDDDMIAGRRRWRRRLRCSPAPDTQPPLQARRQHRRRVR